MQCRLSLQSVALNVAQIIIIIIFIFIFIFFPPVLH
jgi:hypothetical protein